MANSPNKNLAESAFNTPNWDVILNSNFAILDAALGSKSNLTTTSGGYTLSTAEYQSLILYVSGILTGNVTYTIPSGVGGEWIVVNATTGAFTVTFASAAGGTTVAVDQGTVGGIFTDGTSTIGVRSTVTPSTTGNFTTMNTVTANISGALNNAGSVAATGVITPTILASDTNNYAPASASANSVWRISASTPVKITGIAALASGTEIQLINAGSNNITLTSEDAASTASNRMSLPGGVIILRPLDGIRFRYDATLSRWVAIAVPYTAHPCAGGFKSLVVTVTGDTAWSLTADAVTLEDANGFAFRARNVSVSNTATSQGANAIGNASSLTSSTWYYGYVIYNPTTNTIASLTDASATAPTLPSGYTFYARFAAFRVNASTKFLRTIQYGRRAQYVIGTSNPPTAGVIIGTNSNGATSVTSVVPPTASEITVYTNTVSAGGISPNVNYITGSSTNPDIASNAFSGASNSQASLFASIMLEASTIKLYMPGGVSAFCSGWIDNL